VYVRTEYVEQLQPKRFLSKSYQNKCDVNRCESLKWENIIITSIVYLFLYLGTRRRCFVELASKEVPAFCVEMSKREVLYGVLDGVQ
jgi:hypothetical protein